MRSICFINLRRRDWGSLLEVLELIDLILSPSHFLGRACLGNSSIIKIRLRLSFTSISPSVKSLDELLVGLTLIVLSILQRRLSGFCG